MRPEDQKKTVKRKMYERLVDVLIFCVQFATYFMFFIPLRVLFRSRVSLSHNLHNLSRGSLLVANHQSIADPFIVMGRLPFSVFVKLLPVRFPTTHAYMELPVVGQALRFWGCYDVGATPRLRMCTLLKTCDLLRSRKTVFLFPEGTIAESQMNEFNQGIEFFIRETSSVIFVRMDGFNEPMKKHLFKARRTLDYGEVLDSNVVSHDARSLQESFVFLTRPA